MNSKFEDSRDKDLEELKSIWGNKFEENKEKAQDALAAIGLTPEEGIAIEGAIGLKRASIALFRVGGGA